MPSDENSCHFRCDSSLVSRKHFYAYAILGFYVPEEGIGRGACEMVGKLMITLV